MPVYSFKRETKLYIVYNGLKYKLNIYPDVTFSQTFSEEAIRNKTLHSNINFDDAVIIKASPANFSFSVPLVPEHSILFNLLVGFDQAYSSLNSFDIYAQTPVDTYRINGAILENGRFITSMTSVLGMSISGTGKRLLRVGDGTYTIPGTLQTLPSQNYTLIRNTFIVVDDTELDSVSDIYVELRNNVEWIPNDTVQASLQVTGVANTIYPEDFVVSGRTLNGAITQYINSDTATSAQNWSTTARIYIRIGLGGSEYALQLLAPKAVFTNRTDTTDVYTQVYDFRMQSNLDIAQ